MSLIVYVIPTGNGGTIELIYMQVYVCTNGSLRACLGTSSCAIVDSDISVSICRLMHWQLLWDRATFGRSDTPVVLTMAVLWYALSSWFTCCCCICLIIRFRPSLFFFGLNYLPIFFACSFLWGANVVTKIVYFLHCVNCCLAAKFSCITIIFAPYPQYW